MPNLSAYANSFDLALIGCYVAVFVLMNTKAWLPAVELVGSLFVHSLDMRNFDAFMICSAVAFLLSTANIKLSSEIRQAFLCFGGIYLVGAVDNFISYHLNYDTSLHQLTTSAVIMVNAYLLAHLFSDWRRNNANGFTHYCAWHLRRCKITALHLFKHPENKR